MNPLVNHGAPQPAGSANPITNQQQMQALSQRVNMMRRMNPQQLVAQYFPFVPPAMQGDPNQVVQFLIQSGRVSQQQLDQLQQLQRTLGL